MSETIGRLTWPISVVPFKYQTTLAPVDDVAPDQIRMAIAIDIGCRRDLPRRCRQTVGRLTWLRHVVPLRYQTTSGAVDRIAPDQIGMGIAIDVGDRHDLPGEVDHGRQTRLAEQCHAVQIPHDVGPCRDVAPDQIGMRVGVDIRGADNAPVAWSGTDGRLACPSTVVPLRYQTRLAPLELLRQMRSGCVSPLTSAFATSCHV